MPARPNFLREQSFGNNLQVLRSSLSFPLLFPHLVFSFPHPLPSSLMLHFEVVPPDRPRAGKVLGTRLGLTMVPRKNKNNAYAKFGGTNKEYYGIFGNGLYEVSIILSTIFGLAKIQ